MRPSATHTRYDRRLLLALAGLGLLPGWPATAARAGAVVTDGTVGPAKDLPGPAFKVTPDLGRQVGGNLFHSFKQLDLNRGEAAEFSGPASVKNVFARVTGGTPSSIDGTLRSTIQAADFYFMNPAGVVFGPNAALDVKGSFAVTTADYLKLADGGRVDARAPAASVLTSAPPVAFGFLGPAGGIALRRADGPAPAGGATLTAGPGKHVLVVGGDVRISGGSVMADRGRVDVVATASAGEVVPAAAVPGSPLDVSGFPNLGTVELTNVGAITAEGPGAAVRVAARDVTLRGTPDLLGGLIGVETETGRPGDVVINAAGSLVVVDSTVSSRSRGEPGLVSVTAGDVAVGNGGRIFSTGDLRLSAAGALTVAGGFVGTSAAGSGTADVTAGTISVSTPDGASELGTVGSDSSGGRSGDVRVTAAGSVTLDQGRIRSGSEAGPGSGSVHVSAGQVTLAGTEAGITSDSPSGTAGPVQVSATAVRVDRSARVMSSGGAGSGDVTVTATGAVTVGPPDPGQNSEQGLRISRIASDSSAGDAGGVRVSASDVRVEEVASVGSTAAGRSGDVTVSASATVTVSGGIFSSGSGEAGVVDVSAADVSVTAGGFDSSADGPSGGVRVTATGDLNLSGGGVTAHSGSSEAGPIRLSAKTLTLGGRDAATADVPVVRESGHRAGTIHVTATDLNLFGGWIETLPREGGGGTIDVQAGTVRVGLPGRERARIRTQTFGDLASGDIRVRADTLEIANGEISSGTRDSVQEPGIGGTIDVAAKRIVLGSDGGIGDITHASVFPGELAGPVRIRADELTVVGGAIRTDTFFSGRGGDVEITADTVTLDGGRRDAGIFTTAFVGPNKGGNISVTAGTLNLINGATIEASSIDPPEDGAAVPGDVRVTARAVTVTGRNPASVSGIVSSGPRDAAAGPANISVAADVVRLADGGRIVADTFGAGGGGGGSVEVVGRRVDVGGGGSISAAGYGGGTAGRVRVEADAVTLAGGASISAANFDNDRQTGNISVTAGSLTLLDRSTITASGGGGLAAPLTVSADLEEFGLDVDKDQLSVSLVSPAGTRLLLAQGFARPFTYVDAPDPLPDGVIRPRGFLSRFVAPDLNGAWQLVVENGARDFDGNPTRVELTSWSLSLGGREIGRSTAPAGGTAGFTSPLAVAGASAGLTAGLGGDVTVAVAGGLRVLGGSSITAATTGTGPAGNVSVTADRVLVAGPGSTIGSVSAAPPNGPPSRGGAGNVTVTARDRLTLRDGGATAVRSDFARAGDVRLSGGRAVEIVGNGRPTDAGTRVTAAAPKADKGTEGGNIRIAAGRLVRVKDALVTAETSGDGGRITLVQPAAVLDGSEINGVAAGRDVRVRILADGLLRSNDRILTTTPQTFPESNVAGSLVALPSAALGVDARLVEQCGPVLGRSDSSFVMTGVGGAGPEVGGWSADWPFAGPPAGSGPSGGTTPGAATGGGGPIVPDR